MTRQTWLAVLGLGGAAIWAMAAPPTTPAPDNANRAAIRFRGTSTLHDFTGNVTAQPISFSRTTKAWSARGTVNVAEMSTANPKRDSEMYRMFGLASFPTITASISNAPVPVTGTTNVTMQLRIREREQPVQVQVSNWRQSPSNLQFQASTKVSLKAFGLQPPSVLGLIRVGDTVELEAQVSVGTFQP